MKKADDFDAAIFDLDGTLLDSNDSWAEIDEIYLLKHGITPSPGRSAEMASSSYEEVYEQIKKLGITDSFEDFKAEINEIAENEYTNNIGLKDGAERYLRHLKDSGKKTALLTASPEKLYKPALKAHGIYELFDIFLSAENTDFDKYNEEIYFLCASKLQASPNRCIVFDDLYKCIMAAKSAGMKTVCVYDRYSQLDFFMARGFSDEYIYSFSDLLADPKTT
ncbi:MAG: HAD family phosphatase [Ruminococcus sp.]|jgi:HAD superfamily hydrolase (TIGR01509 family)|nr:HAD family phosphatase [Ruminococcus sp.]